MSRYQVFHPDHESKGQTLIDLANAIDAEEFLPILEKHGLTSIDPDSWYPQQRQLDALSEIAELSGGMYDLVSLGLKMAETAAMPPQFETLSLQEVLMHGDIAYRMTDRGTDPGDVKAEILNDKHFRITLRVPDPDDLWYGIVYGYMRRFSPKGTRFTVYYDQDIPRREQGGKVTVIHAVLD